MADIFAFEDFHSYLTAVYEGKKVLNQKYSYAVMAQQFGIPDRTFVHHILKIAKTRLPASYILKIAEALHLTKKEAEYFNLMVAYTHFLQDGKSDDCAMTKEKMDELRKKVKLQEIRKDQKIFYSQWYHSVVRAVIGMHPFKGDFARLGRILSPPITELQARESVELLVRLEIVTRDSDGVYHLATERNIRTGGEFTQVEKNRIHTEYIKAAKDVLQSNCSGQQVLSMTLGISEKTFGFICEEIGELKEKIRKLAENDLEADRVFLYQSILVPLTKDATVK